MLRTIADAQTSGHLYYSPGHCVEPKASRKDQSVRGGGSRALNQGTILTSIRVLYIARMYPSTWETTD